MTADELAAMIAEEIDNNSGTRAILAKVQRGTATLADSERFTGITAEITGRLLADNVLSLPLSDRQGAFVDITAARYRDTFSVFSAVQRALDERLGINLAVVDPGFEKARAQKAGHALADQTVPESTVVRRAESAGENIVRSQHDRIVLKQAEFRDRAGLQCSVIREGGAKCCDWCASVSGKYPVSDTPQGFGGRHDNCKCSILYETRKGVQRLGGSTKKWEPLEDAGAPEPTRLTAEQAAEREAQHPVIAFTPEQARQTEERNSPLIPSESGISGKQHTRTGENTVDLGMLHSDEYKQKFNGITGNSAVDRRLYEQAVAQLTHRNGTYKEDMVLIDSVTGKIVGRQTRSQSEIGVDYNDSLRRAIASYPRGRLISLHNHPTNNPPTGSDLVSAQKKGFALGVIATHNGRVFTYKTGSRVILAETFSSTVDKYRGMGYNEVEAIIITLQKYAESHDIEWSER